MGFVTVVMSKEFPVFLYISCVSIVLSSFSRNFAFIKLASTPNTKGKEFLVFWKQNEQHKRLTKEEKLKLKAASKEIGWTIGFVKNVKADTSLKLADVFLSCIATLVLMKPSKKYDI